MKHPRQQCGDGSRDFGRLLCFIIKLTIRYRAPDDSLASDAIFRIMVKD
jgi:hypothetical protein